MRKKPYIVFPRKLKRSVVWYYHTYTSDGQRTAARFTGQETKSAAMAWLAKRHKEDKLIPAAYPLFRDWAERWWRWRGCPYVNARLACGFRISPLHVKTGRQLPEKHVLPTLGKKRLSAIEPADIEKLLLVKHDEERRQCGFVFHSQKHTFFTRLRVRLSDAQVRPLAGHRTETMTERHDHLTEADLSTALGALEELFG